MSERKNKPRCQSCRWWERSYNFRAADRDWGLCHLFGGRTGHVFPGGCIDGTYGHEPRGSDTCGFHNSAPSLKGAVPKALAPKFKAGGEAAWPRKPDHDREHQPTHHRGGEDMRSFGPVVVMMPDRTEIDRAHCNYCIFLTRNNGLPACDHEKHKNGFRQIPDQSNTPDWCGMKEGALRDASDMANGVEHYVVRWSGRKTDEPREIYAGVPSEAARQFRLASRDARRGTVQLEDRAGAVLAKWPEESA